eukprot:403350866
MDEPLLGEATHNLVKDLDLQDTQNQVVRVKKQQRRHSNRTQDQGRGSQVKIKDSQSISTSLYPRNQNIDDSYNSLDTSKLSRDENEQTNKNNADLHDQFFELKYQAYTELKGGFYEQSLKDSQNLATQKVLQNQKHPQLATNLVQASLEDSNMNLTKTRNQSQNQSRLPIIDEYEIEEKRNVMYNQNGTINDAHNDQSSLDQKRYSTNMYNNPKLLSGIMMRGSPTFLSKEDDILQNHSITSNFMSRNLSKKFGGAFAMGGIGTLNLDSSQNSMLRSQFSQQQ